MWAVSRKRSKVKELLGQAPGAPFFVSVSDIDSLKNSKLEQTIHHWAGPVYVLITKVSDLSTRIELTFPVLPHASLPFILSWRAQVAHAAHFYLSPIPGTYLVSGPVNSYHTNLRK